VRSRLASLSSIVLAVALTGCHPPPASVLCLTSRLQGAANYPHQCHASHCHQSPRRQTDFPANGHHRQTRLFCRAAAGLRLRLRLCLFLSPAHVTRDVLCGPCTSQLVAGLGLTAVASLIGEADCARLYLIRLRALAPVLCLVFVCAQSRLSCSAYSLSAIATRLTRWEILQYALPVAPSTRCERASLLLCQFEEHGLDEAGRDLSLVQCPLASLLVPRCPDGS
jgi:hypothetical protein